MADIFFCSNCGSTVYRSERYCSGCGTTVRPQLLPASIERWLATMRGHAGAAMHRPARALVRTVRAATRSAT